MSHNIPMKLLDWIDETIIYWNWYYLSRNPNAIRLLEQNPQKIFWSNLSENPNAICLLEQNPDKIDWYYLSRNPNIFTYDYVAMREEYKELKEELIQRAWHPMRIAAWLDAGMDIDDL